MADLETPSCLQVQNNSSEDFLDDDIHERLTNDPAYRGEIETRPRRTMDRKSAVGVETRKKRKPVPEGIKALRLNFVEFVSGKTNGDDEEKGRIADIFIEYVEKRMPELIAIENARIDLYIEELIDDIPTYEGFRHDGSAVLFFEEKYKFIIKSGFLTHEILRNKDKKLLKALKNELYRTKNSASLEDYISSNVNNVKARFEYLAEIFDIDINDYDQMVSQICRIISMIRTLESPSFFNLMRDDFVTA